ncbi:MAG: HEAT repeat domain-containing protein [Candidatus Aminicenantes bacterium]|nr:HEAT repeat domain-containing protein [Candidatus Aminicenantes bacterium]
MKKRGKPDMSHTLRVFRPQRTPVEQLEKTFVAREPFLQEILDRLAKWQPGGSRQHYLIIGPRGIGKTNLLRMVEHRIEQTPELSSKWHSLSLSEDAYGITNVANLLIEALRIFTEKVDDKEAAETYERVKYDDDDARVTDLSLDAFRKFHRRHNCGILLMVENVNRVFENQFRYKKELHLLRKILIEEEWLVLVSTSPTHLNAVTTPEEPLFEFFQVKLLEELSPEQQREMLRRIALLEENIDFVESYLDKLRPQLMALYHFTGGNPRLTIMLYDLVANRSITDVKTELESLLDKITPFYQDRMKEISEQEAGLLERMCLMAEGCSPTELAKEARMEPKTVRALITRLERSGYIRREPRRHKRTFYIIPERFFRIWHQMNHSRAARGRIQYLLEFFTSWYATPQERDSIWKKLSAEFETVLRANEEERIDEIDEYMQYIAEISERKEKYERHFDRLYQIYKIKDFDAIKVELDHLDKEYSDDGYYFLNKGIFLLKKIKNKSEAFLSFRAANDLLNYNIFVYVADLEKHSPGLAVQLLIDSLMHDNAGKRGSAATALGKIGSEAAVPALIECLKDEANDVRGSAATALGKIGLEGAVPALIDCLKDEADNVRGSAANALGEIGSEEAAPALIEGLKDVAHNVRGSAANALGRIGSESAVPALIECINDKNNIVRGSAISALGKIGFESAVPALIDCLKDEDPINRGSAATALGEIGSGAVVPALIDCLKDEANDVRGSAAFALGKIGSEEAVPALIDCLKDEASGVRGSVAFALGEIGSEEAVPALIECLIDKAKDVRISSIIALGKIASTRPVQNIDKVIRVLIEIKSNEIRNLIVKAIRELLDSAFRWGDVDTISASVEHAKKGFKKGPEIFKPYIVALDYITSNRDPAVLERQQPEMREAAQLLIHTFDNS